MQAKPPRSTFQVLDVAIEAIESLAPIVARIRRHDRDLGEQLRTALSSTALNAAEGNHSQGGHRIARFSTAAGSNAESRAALRVAVAWGYVSARDIEAGEARLDRIAAMLYRLGAKAVTRQQELRLSRRTVGNPLLETTKPSRPARTHPALRECFHHPACGMRRCRAGQA
jgi:four helix bundle protein